MKLTERNLVGELVWAIKARRRYEFWMKAWHYKMEQQRWADFDMLPGGRKAC